MFYSNVSLSSEERRHPFWRCQYQCDAGTVLPEQRDPPEDTCQQRVNNTRTLTHTHPDCCQVHGQETVTAHASSPTKPCCWSGPPSETLQTNSSSYSGFLHWRLSGTQPDPELQSVSWNSDTSVKLCWRIDALKQMPYVWLLVRNCAIWGFMIYITATLL